MNPILEGVKDILDILKGSSWTNEQRLDLVKFWIETRTKREPTPNEIVRIGDGTTVLKSVWTLVVPDKPGQLLDNAGYFTSKEEAEQFAIKMELYGTPFEIPPVGGFKQPEGGSIIRKFEAESQS